MFIFLSTLNPLWFACTHILERVHLFKGKHKGTDHWKYQPVWTYFETIEHINIVKIYWTHLKSKKKLAWNHQNMLHNLMIINLLGNRLITLIYKNHQKMSKSKPGIQILQRLGSPNHHCNHRWSHRQRPRVAGRAGGPSKLETKEIGIFHVWMMLWISHSNFHWRLSEVKPAWPNVLNKSMYI
jgi:hypothetical protein